MEAHLCQKREWTLFVNLCENTIEHASSSNRTLAPRAPKTEGLFEVSNPLDVTTKVDALSRDIYQLMAAGFSRTTTPYMPLPQEACSFCSSPSHHARDCPIVGQFSEISHEQMNATFSRLVMIRTQISTTRDGKTIASNVGHVGSNPAKLQVSGRYCTSSRHTIVVLEVLSKMRKLYREWVKGSDRSYEIELGSTILFIIKLSV
jgi:hypothetical protein